MGYVVEHLGDADAVGWGRDGFLKKGNKSVGAAAVQRHGLPDRKLPGWLAAIPAHLEPRSLPPTTTTAGPTRAAPLNWASTCRDPASAHAGQLQDPLGRKEHLVRQGEVLKAVDGMTDSFLHLPLKDFPHLDSGLADYYYDWLEHPTSTTTGRNSASRSSTQTSTWAGAEHRRLVRHFPRGHHPQLPGNAETRGIRRRTTRPEY